MPADGPALERASWPLSWPKSNISEFTLRRPQRRHSPANMFWSVDHIEVCWDCQVARFQKASYSVSKYRLLLVVLFISSSCCRQWRTPSWVSLDDILPRAKTSMASLISLRFHPSWRLSGAISQNRATLNPMRVSMPLIRASGKAIERHTQTHTYTLAQILPSIRIR